MVPRSAQADWGPRVDGIDPVEILRHQDAIRIPELVSIGYGRMLESPFTFYRGSAALMAADLAKSPTTGINVQACGDAHVGNVGIYATPERELVFDVNDFDETHAGPWEFDLKRLVASVVLDGRDARWDAERGAEAVRIVVARYRDALVRLSELTTLESHFAKMDETRFFREYTEPAVVSHARQILHKARKRTHAQAVRKWVTTVDGIHQFIDDPPLLTRLRAEEFDRFRRLFHRYRDTVDGWSWVSG